jgi:glutamate-1-semialdehyde 2,1-aminomutase
VKELNAETVAKLTQIEFDYFQTKTKKSLGLAQRAIEVLPLGVPTNVCALDPYPLVIDHGQGAYLFDIDENKYVDYGNGFGATLFGHANPDIGARIESQSKRGVHFGALTEIVVEWSEHLCQRQNLDWIRFNNSGTEATMDALRIARAHTGRTKIAKIEGGYHGSHPEALVSPNLELDGTEGPDDNPASRPWGLGLSPSVLTDVVTISFNDIEMARDRLQSKEIAAVLVEPILFNVGAIWPQDNYLEKLRQLCDETETVLIFDETKTGVTVAYGGAEELFSTTPHLKTLGKGIGGGLAVGAVGGADDWGYTMIQEWELPHLGTFSGNPLTAAAGVGALVDVLDAAAYTGLEAHRRYLTDLLTESIKEYQLPAYVVGAGAKGCVVWAESELRDFRDYKRRFNGEAGYLSWLWLINRGVFLPPGHDEQWTHSVAHTDADADHFANVFEELAKALRA